MDEANQNLFDQVDNTNESVETFLDKYVGDGKKFKDVEALAKAYENANTHIPKLETKLDDMNTFITAQFENLNKRTPDTPPPNPNDRVEEPKPAPATPPKEEDGEDLDTRIQSLMDERDETNRLRNNANYAQDVLIEHFGSQEKAVEAVQKRATELGVSAKFLADTAFSSPQALFKLMEVEPNPRSRNTPSVSPDVNPRVLDQTHSGPKPGTYAYYEQIRKTNPSLYMSPKIQNEMMAAAQEKGSDFFNR